MRKKTEACLAGIVTRPEGSGGLPLGAKSTDPKTGNTLERMYLGMIEYLKPGEDIKFNAPAATGGYREYLTTELQGIGAGIDVPYELLSGNLSLVNYSSYRAGMLGFRNAIEAFRWLTLIPMFCRPTWQRFIDTLVLTGKLRKADYSVQWTAPKFESVDPLKDAMAELKRIRTGTLTLPEVAQNGYDPEKPQDHPGLRPAQRKRQGRRTARRQRRGISWGCQAEADGQGVGAVLRFAVNQDLPAITIEGVFMDELEQPAPVPSAIADAVHAGTEARDLMAQTLGSPPVDPGVEVERFAVAIAFAPSSADSDKRTIDVVWYTGAKVPRYDYRTGEEYDLVLSMKGCRLDRLNNGGPVLDSHSAFAVESQLGVVRKAWTVGATGKATIQFSKRDGVTPVWNDVQAGIIQNLSPGMWIYKKVDTTPKGQECKAAKESLNVVLLSMEERAAGIAKIQEEEKREIGQRSTYTDDKSGAVRHFKLNASTLETIYKATAERSRRLT